MAVMTMMNAMMNMMGAQCRVEVTYYKYVNVNVNVYVYHAHLQDLYHYHLYCLEDFDPYRYQHLSVHLWIQVVHDYLYDCL